MKAQSEQLWFNRAEWLMIMSVLFLYGLKGQVCMKKEICLLENLRSLESGLYGKRERVNEHFSRVMLDGISMKCVGSS